MIRKPSAPDLYGFFEDQARMPPFGNDQLSNNDLNMISRFLHGDYLLPPADSSAIATAKSAGTNHPDGVQKR
jgi:hypothetical protein